MPGKLVVMATGCSAALVCTCPSQVLQNTGAKRVQYGVLGYIMMTKVTHTNQCPSHHTRQARPCPPYVALLRAIHSINLVCPSPVFGLVCTIIRITEKYYQRAFRFVPAFSCLSPLLSGWPNLVGGVWVPTGDERPREWRLENGEPALFFGGASTGVPRDVSK